MKQRRQLSGLALAVFATLGAIAARAGEYPGLKLDTGKHIYEAACVACHGPGGKGMPKASVGFEKPDSFPDFTRCDQTTSELNKDYKAVVVHGGQFHGFSQIMPAFGEALSNEQINMVVGYLRGFCTNSHWPRGELNLPRALVTNKAYPENETILTQTINARGLPAVSSEVEYERRFGMRNELEVAVPFMLQDERHTWYGGTGDSAIGLKHELYSNLHAGSIFSLFGGVSFPTGKRSDGFGTGTTTFQTFAAYDQLLPEHFFVQFQGGAYLPTRTQLAPQSLFWNTVIGNTAAQDKGLGRMWSPMVELLANRDLAKSAKTEWDVLPQLQVTLSRRQHLRADIGLRLPATNTAGREPQVMFYLLWDWQDGKLTQGW